MHIWNNVVNFRILKIILYSAMKYVWKLASIIKAKLNAMLSLFFFFFLQMLIDAI